MNSYPVVFDGVTYNVTHGCPFDRGAADSYYRRKAVPHYMKNIDGVTKRIQKEEMSQDEIKEYCAGFNFNLLEGSFKEY